MIFYYWSIFSELICTPFQHIELIWGIVPLYFGLLLNELTSGKANFRTAIQTGFSFLWASAQWLYPYFKPQVIGGRQFDWSSMPRINLVVTIVVILFGAAALFSGIRRRYPKYGSFLGYTRFSNYFMITIFPIQAHALTWNWDRLVAISLFAVPIWLILHFGLMPLRK
jgi:hypothetical protein